MKIKEKQKLTKKWFKDLQNLICKNIEDLEKKYGSRKKFKKNRWKYGEFRIIEGEIIEKGGVAFSNVIGKFPKTFAKNIPGTKKSLIFGHLVFRLYYTLITLKFLLCISIHDSFVQKKIGLVVEWMRLLVLKITKKKNIS